MAGSQQAETITELSDAVADELDADVVLYSGAIYRPSDDTVIQELQGRRRRKNVLLVLVTPGGDANTAYKIARYLQHTYERFYLLVSGDCKSSGTLIAVAASELIMTEMGELGPLDIQMDKKGEIWEQHSGLTVQSAMASLNERAFLAFEHFVQECRGRRMHTQLSSDVAVKLTNGLFAGIYSQVDPLHVGEAARSLAIASRYGMRLEQKSGNLKEKALTRLISDYPVHGFVIDRTEAADLFKNVRPPTQAEAALIKGLGPLALHPLPWEYRREPFIWVTSSQRPEPPMTGEESKEGVTAGGAHASPIIKPVKRPRGPETASAGNGGGGAAPAAGEPAPEPPSPVPG